MLCNRDEYQDVTRSGLKGVLHDHTSPPCWLWLNVKGSILYFSKTQFEDFGYPKKIMIRAGKDGGTDKY